MSTTVILDCDPGHDDAVALFMALASEKLELALVTTSAGNQVPEKTYLNARRLLALAGREDIPVAAGASRPLRRELIIAAGVHGETGLDGAALPEPTVPGSSLGALEAMVGVIEGAAAPVTIVATGPLTNVAILLISHPELKPRIAEISIMGGACFGGNITPNAEFNIYVDPEAADLVFSSGVPIAMFGLDVTHQAQFMPEDVDRVRALGTPTGDAFAAMLDFYARAITRPFLAADDHVEGIHMHDPCAVAYLIDPGMFTMLPMRVDVVTSDGLALGMTVVDYNGKSGRPTNARVAFAVDRDRFAELVHSSLASFR